MAQAGTVDPAGVQPLAWGLAWLRALSLLHLTPTVLGTTTAIRTAIAAALFAIGGQILVGTL